MPEQQYRQLISGLHSNHKNNLIAIHMCTCSHTQAFSWEKILKKRFIVIKIFPSAEYLDSEFGLKLKYLWLLSLLYLGTAFRERVCPFLASFIYLPMFSLFRILSSSFCITVSSFIFCRSMRYREQLTMGYLAPVYWFTTQPWTLKAEGHQGRGVRKIVRGRGLESLLQNCVFLMWKGSYTHENSTSWLLKQVLINDNTIDMLVLIGEIIWGIESK